MFCAGSLGAVVMAGWYLYAKRKGKRVMPLVLSSMLSLANTEKKGRKRDARASGAAEAPLSVLLSSAAEGRVTKALINGSAVYFSLKDSNKLKVWRKCSIPSDSPSVHSKLLEALTEGGCSDISTLPEPLMSRLSGPATASIPFIYLALLYKMLTKLQRSHNDDDGIDNHSSALPPSTTFAHVAGIDTAKIELSEIVSYLRNPAKYKQLGASIPRGVLLHGPPGSGKTLLAKALAGEAQVDAFLACTGSDFVEMYVGRGAARVRTFFHSARTQAVANFAQRHGHHHHSALSHALSFLPWRCHNIPLSNKSAMHDNPTAVVFIDEIDALAKTRASPLRNSNSFLGGGGGGSNSGGNDEREQTLNQLLSEMDGFHTSTSSSSTHNQKDLLQNVTVIVIAATNRPDVLDPALLRPGRFDRHVHVTYPNAKGREEILRLHSKRIQLLQQHNTSNKHAQQQQSTNSNTVDLSIIASDSYTHNFSGADLSNVINEAAFYAVRDNSDTVNQTHLIRAAKKVHNMKRCIGTNGGSLNYG